MSNETLIADVLDALVTTWRADATLAALGARLRIFDGPPTTDRAAEIELWIGATGLEADETVVEGVQAFATFADALDVDEALDISNAIWVANGANDVSTARRTAITTFNAAAAAVRGSSLGLSALYPATTVTGWQLRQGQFTSGVGAVLTFTVHATGQI